MLAGMDPDLAERGDQVHGGASAAPDSTRRAPLRIAVVVSFLNEAEYLPRLLASVADQTEPPEQLLLVDDGSQDRSPDIAQQFAAANAYARALRRTVREAEGDRLVDAPELRAFSWGVDQLEDSWDIVSKLDGDLELPPTLLAEVRQAFGDDPKLGITGSYLSILGPGETRKREYNPPYHVRGPNKFYRRECYRQITPLPTFLGWDTVDDLRARRLGWSTRSFLPTSGEALHLRPTGAHDGRLRAFRRWGRCAWGYGAHPLWVLLGAMRRVKSPPYGLGGINYLLGWCTAAVRRYPRAEPSLLEHCRHEDLLRIRRALSAVRLRPGGHPAPAAKQRLP